MNGVVCDPACETETMNLLPDYRRYRIAGGCYFFTANLLDRRRDTPVRHVRLSRQTSPSSRRTGMWLQTRSTTAMTIRSRRGFVEIFNRDRSGGQAIGKLS